VPDVLRLEVTDYTDLTRWRWVLRNESGAFLADHDVRLDRNDAWFEAFTGLQRYIDWHTAPDRRMIEERRIVMTLGDWIGTKVFGPDIGRALLEHAPATVQVVLPTSAEPLAYLPLEVVRLQSRSLAGHDITLVIQPPTSKGSPAKTVRMHESLRVLGLFSLPEGRTALNLRRERQSLVTLISQIADTGRAADIKALQYGVTRDKLRGILAEGGGWDIIHIAGHGAPGQLVLETADGRPDHISAADLSGLLDLTRDRVKLVTVSACWSAALAIAEPRRRLGLPIEEDQRQHSAETIRASVPSQHPAPGDIAATLASRLDCAVLAMRFPVSDEFAIELSAKLYELLAGKGQSLPVAVTMTLKHLADRPVEEWFPALSIAAPTIFGATAPALVLKAPERTAPMSGAAEHPKMAGDFPPQSERFVGRTGVMTRASAVLAPDSGVPGVLLHGMPGGGKTACALELAHTHKDAFDQLIWFKAPDEGAAIDGSITDLALTLEKNIPDFQMSDKVIAAESMTGFLPKLTELMERNRLLLVIDNIESLLTDENQWHDKWWGKVIGALTSHNGRGRLIITSRRVSTETPLTITQESVGGLTADETLLLTRELPHLSNLINGKAPRLDADTSRNFALSVLDIAQGHPKLLELANGQAAQPEQLAALIQAGGQVWQELGSLPAGFFAAGNVPAAPVDYLRVLAAWTNVVTNSLSSGERDLFWLLCCLEEPDRLEAMLNYCWPRIWKKLSRNGQLPRLDEAVLVVTESSLAAKKIVPNDIGSHYGIHPGIAAAGRAQAGENFQSVVDAEAGALWTAMFRKALKENVSRMVVHAGLAAVPYFNRQQQWAHARGLLSVTSEHDQSRTTTAAVLRALHPIAPHDTEAADLLSRVQTRLKPGAQTEPQIRAAMKAAVDSGDYDAASIVAGSLVDLLRREGRLAEALKLFDQKMLYTRKANSGTWAQVNDEALRLQVLNEMGRHSEVLNEVKRLLSRIETLPTSPQEKEISAPSIVYELLLDTGSHAASKLMQWQNAIDLHSAHIDSLQARAVPLIHITRAKFNAYGPLLHLGRADEARDLLLECRQIFEEAGEVEMLGSAFGALAEIEHRRGHGNAAVRLERDALRYSYQAQDVVAIAVAYSNLGNYLRIHARQPVALANHLASALIRELTGIRGTGDEVHAAAVDLRVFGPAAKLPKDVADLCRNLSTDPSGLIAKLSSVPAVAELALMDLVLQTMELAIRGESGQKK
jgi:tetratricopeptide (TPR) repeat protein